MKSARTALVVLVTGFVATAPTSAQSQDQPGGDTLRLIGNASISFEGTKVKAEGIAIDQTSKQVVFTTVRNILVGSASRCAPPPSSFPKIQYR